MFRKLGLLALAFAVGLTLAGCGASTIWAEGTLDDGVATLAPMAEANFASSGAILTSPSSFGSLSTTQAQMLAQAGLSPLNTEPCADSGSYSFGTQDGADFIAYDNCKTIYADDGSYILENGTFWYKQGSGENFDAWTSPVLKLELYDPNDALELGVYMDMDVAFSGSDGTYGLDYYLDYGISDGTDTFSMFFDMVYGYVPDPGVTDPMNAGKITFDGTMRFRETVSETGSRYEYNLNMATKDFLHQTNGVIDDGAAEYSDGDDVLRIEATGSGEYTVTYNGQPYLASFASLGSFLR
jgi:hypothetical protein